MYNDSQNGLNNLSNASLNNVSVKIEINKGASFAEVVFDGEVNRKTLDNSFLELIKHPNFRFNMNACYDYSKAHSGLNMSEIEEHAQFVAAHSNVRGQHYKLAFVSNETFNNALLNVYKLLISKTSVEAEVFSSRNLATNWLKNSI